MTGSWLTLNAAADRLSKAWNKPVSIVQVLLLGEQDLLKVRFEHGIYSVLEESVSELATRSGDVLAEHADKPAWTPWTDPDFRLEQADYSDDTPNDEGDND